VKTKRESNKMKKYFFSLCTFLLLSLNTHIYPQTTYWESISNQIPGDSLNDLSDVSVPNRWVGFISSKSEPEIYRGDFWTGIWELLQTPTSVTAIYFWDYDYGFLCGVDSTVYQTTNAGESWNYFSSLGEKINDLDFGYDIYNLKGYICGNNGLIGCIEDTSLIIINSGFSTDFIKISFPQDENIWLVGDSSVYLYSGSTFIKQFTSDVKLNSVHFWGELNGWIVGDSGYIAKTTDGGNTWIQKQNPDMLKRNLNDIYLIYNFGFAIGDDGLILETSNSGETWTMTGQLTTNKLVSIHISGGGSEWGPALAVGENKTALIYPIVVSVDDEPSAVDNFYLYQNYPNPFNPTTKIKFSIPSVTLRQAQSDILITLKVYDVLSNEIATLVSEELQPGEYEVEFSASGRPESSIKYLVSGVYFYQLKAGDPSTGSGQGFVQTKKMILLR
jgi:photosystem II stability/assembly factor-like uncharacterized protein